MPRVPGATLATLLQFKFKEKPSSTCCADVSYDPETNDMTVAFVNRGTYIYHEVPLDEYVDFASSGSQGTYFNLYIRPKYTNFERIS
jgi:hypothetical protein